MARNEEKQHGKLNRLWLQKEREEGRIKDVHERRPKLSTLNSASSVKKWIPSIKSEIEYYLQQSQLTHYPERKIAEFQLCIGALEKEYKRFITKLRALDPLCKHKPWTPRAYTKRRAETHGSQTTAKKPLCSESHDLSGPLSGRESDFTSQRTGSNTTSPDVRWGHLSQSEAKPRTSAPTNPRSELAGADQDQPLCFDHTRLAVALAGFRGPVVQPGSSPTHSLARVLQAGLPNLHSSSLSQTVAAQRKDTAVAGGENIAMGSVTGQKGAVTEHKLGRESTRGTTERSTEKSNNSEPIKEGTGHVLGLDCYSSSDEESDT